MDKDRAVNTNLIEREDDLLEQIDACQQILAATWRFLRETDEPIHLPALRRLMMALRTVERSIDDEMLDVRLELLQFAKPPAGGTPGANKALE
ncbi:hypothetical protein M5X11_07990 [Paenibacillus alginolyticus]|uniref:hypothetical protein n=1 Tax=Paenibacillus alginolyticus TaxID=59839 RepID=UPI000492B5F3|nr:hypothetical protein [Paenibacillus alginolyticus]MCY9664897.1 hypothetical protein [Paenibacillus alginolyticus]